MPDLLAILDTIRHQPDDERNWSALASWLRDYGRYDDDETVESLVKEYNARPGNQ